MSLSFKIIKGAEVSDNILKVLPLRRFTPKEKPLTAQEVNKEEKKDETGLPSLTLERAAAQAEEILGRARSAADGIISEANCEAEKIRQQAYQDGFNQGSIEGTDKGYRDGVDLAREEAAAIRQQAADVLEQAEKIRRQTMEAMEQEVVDLAREIAERLLSTQLAVNPETVVNIAAESLRLVADRLSVVLYINPADAELFESRKEGLKTLLPAKAELKVVTDQGIRSGGCRVETEQGKVDATLEKRMEEMFKVLYGREGQAASCR